MQHDRQVQKDEGNALAQRIGASFFEGSAKDGTNVEDAFFQLVRLIRDFRQRARPGGANAKPDRTGRASGRAGARRGGCSLL